MKEPAFDLVISTEVVEHLYDPRAYARSCFSALKIWSGGTLGQLLSETGFDDVQFRGAGRVLWLWMTMVMSGSKPAESL